MPQHPLRNRLGRLGTTASVAVHAPNTQASTPVKRDRIAADDCAGKLEAPLETVFIRSTRLQRHIAPIGDDCNFAEQWDSVYRGARHQTIFLSRDWIQTWLETYGSHFDKNWSWWTKGEMIVGACLLLRRKVRVKTFTFDTLFLNTTSVTPERSPVAEFNDILCLPGFEAEVAADFIALLSELKWDRFVVDGYLSGGVISSVVADVRWYRTETESKPASYVNLRELADVPFSEQLTSSVRSQIRRCQRIYQDRFGPVSIISMQTLEAAIDCFDQMADLHNGRWRKKGEQGSFSSGPAVEFHHRLISRLWTRDQVELICVKAGENIVGILYNFIDSGKVYFFQSGFVYDSDNRLKPGLLTHSLAIDSYRTRGLREYDFLAGDSQYKRSLAKNQRLLYWTTIYRDKGRVKLFLKCREAKVMLEKMKGQFGAKTGR